MKETKVSLSVKTNNLTGENDYSMNVPSQHDHIIIDLIITR